MGLYRKFLNGDDESVRRYTARILYRKHPRSMPLSQRARKALLLNVTNNPIIQSKKVRRELLKLSMEIELPSLP